MLTRPNAEKQDGCENHLPRSVHFVGQTRDERKYVSKKKHGVLTILTQTEVSRTPMKRNAFTICMDRQFVRIGRINGDSIRNRNEHYGQLRLGYGNWENRWPFDPRTTECQITSSDWLKTTVS